MTSRECFWHTCNWYSSLINLVVCVAQSVEQIWVNRSFATRYGCYSCAFTISSRNLSYHTTRSLSVSGIHFTLPWTTSDAEINISIHLELKRLASFHFLGPFVPVRLDSITISCSFVAKKIFLTINSNHIHRRVCWRDILWQIISL